MKIFNKIIYSKKEPLNQNDIWFDGSSLKVFKDGNWETIGGGGTGDVSQEQLEEIIGMQIPHSFNKSFNEDFAI